MTCRFSLTPQKSGDAGYFTDDGVAFVADDGARLNVGPDIEQGFEVTPVEGFAAGQVEGDDIPGGVRFCVNFRGEAATRAPERLAFLPPFAPAADT